MWSTKTTKSKRKRKRKRNTKPSQNNSNKTNPIKSSRDRNKKKSSNNSHEQTTNKTKYTQHFYAPDDKSIIKKTMTLKVSYGVFIRNRFLLSIHQSLTNKTINKNIKREKTPEPWDDFIMRNYDETYAPWIDIAIPCSPCYYDATKIFNNALLLNYNEIIIITQPSIYKFRRDIEAGIYKYDITKQKAIFLTSYKDLGIPGSCNILSSTLDKENQKLYLFIRIYNDYFINIIDLNTNDIKQHKFNIKLNNWVYFDPAIIAVNDTLHFINDNLHLCLVFDNDERMKITRHEFKYHCSLDVNILYQIQKQLVVTTQEGCLIYSINDNIWKKFSWSGSLTTSYYCKTSAFVSRNERYIFLYQASWICYLRGFYILDLENMTAMKSECGSPQHIDDYSLFSIYCNHERDYMIICGFVTINGCVIPNELCWIIWDYYGSNIKNMYDIYYKPTPNWFTEIDDFYVEPNPNWSIETGKIL